VIAGSVERAETASLPGAPWPSDLGPSLPSGHTDGVITSLAWTDKSEYPLNEGRAVAFGRPHNARRAVHHETEVTIRADQGVENVIGS